MADVLNRTTNQYRRSVNTPDFPVSDWIHNPDLSAVMGFDSRYWVITGDTVSLMDQAARDAVDAAELSTQRDSVAGRMDRAESFERAFALLMLDELNRQADRFNELLNAIDTATNLGNLRSTVQGINDLPVRTAVQLRTALRNRMNT